MAVGIFPHLKDCPVLNSLSSRPLSGLSLPSCNFSNFRSPCPIWQPSAQCFVPCKYFHPSSICRPPRTPMDRPEHDPLKPRTPRKYTEGALREIGDSLPPEAPLPSGLQDSPVFTDPVALHPDAYEWMSSSFGKPRIIPWSTLSQLSMSPLWGGPGVGGATWRMGGN